MWDTGDDRPLGSASSASSFAEISSGSQLLTGPDSDGYLQVWDSSKYRLPAGARGDLLVLDGTAVSPDGSLMASLDMDPADGYARLLSTVTGAVVGEPMLVDPTGSRGAIMMFSPDGRMLATASLDNYVRLWKVPGGTADGKAIRLPLGPGSTVTAVAFSPDGDLLATSETSGSVQLWSVRTRAKVGNPMEGGDAIAFSPDGRLLASVDTQGNIWLYRTADQVPIAEVAANSDSEGLDTGRSQEIAFSPDGRLLASIGTDGHVRLWNADTGRSVGLPIPAKDSAAAGSDSLSDGGQLVAFSSDGKLLVSVDADGDVQPWETWLFTDPHAALCAEVGPLTAAQWQQYAPSEPQSPGC